MSSFQPLPQPVLGRTSLLSLTVFSAGFILAFFLGLQTVSAQATGAGSTGVNFEKIGLGARAAGMGEAFTAVADDSTAMYWNPGGLVLARGTQFSLTHSEWVQGISDEYLAFSQNLERDGAFGGSMHYLGTGSFTGSLENPDGSYGGVGNNISFTAYMASAAYAQRLGNWLPGSFFKQSMVGLEISAVGQDVSHIGNSGVVFNLGYMFEAIHKTLYIGTLISDLGTDIQYYAEPLNANLAGSLHIRGLLMKQDQNILAVDTIGYIDTGLGFKIGDEYKLNFDRNAVALRLGFRAGSALDEVTNLTAGVGLYHSFDDFDGSLDYAFVPYGVLGETHRITLNIIVGGNPIPPKVYVNSAAIFVLGRDTVTLDIAYVNEQPANRWKINILDSSGVLIRSVWGKGAPPEHYPWDGKDQNGKLVPQGNYSVTAEVIDEDNMTGRSTPHPVYAQWVPKKVPYQYTYGFAGDLLFDSGQADLLIRGYQAIQKAATAIQAKYPNAAIQIAGHTDNVRVAATGKFKDNQELSLARAKSVLDFLVRGGMNINQLSVIGYGDTKPIAPNTTPEGRAKNRRVELVVSGSVEVGSDDLIVEGRKLMDKKFYKEALDVFLKAVEADSRNAKAYRYAGDCYLLLGGKDQAVQAYVKAIEYDPTNTDLKGWLNQYAPGSIPTPVPIRVQTGDETPTPVPQAQTGGGSQQALPLPGMP